MGEEVATGGRIRIQGSAMPHFLDAKMASDSVHNIMRRWAGRFINEERSIQSGEVVHRIIIAALSKRGELNHGFPCGATRFFSSTPTSI